MDRISQRPLIVALALAMAAPTVLAWSAYGSQEPSTVWDRTDGRMFPTPDASRATGSLAGERVYFNAFPTSNIYPTTAAVPANSATLATRVSATPTLYWRAMLGVWKDCNLDGYVGSAETALIDYRAELLALPNVNGVTPGTSVCPVTPRTYNGDPVHNDGVWVKEFIDVGMVDPCEFETAPYRAQKCGGIGAFSRNPDVLYLNGTFVWFDQGHPGQAAGGGSCPIVPPPRGTTAGTGGILYYVDCLDGRRVARSVNDADAAAGGGTGLRFEDPGNPGASSSLLNQHFPVTLWGNPYNGRTGLVQAFDPADSRYAYNPAFSVQDCSRPRTDLVRDPTAGPTGNGSLNQVGVKAPAGTPDAAKNNQDYLVASANFTDNNGVILGYYGFRAPSGVNPTGSYWAAAEDANDAVYYGPNYQSKTAGDCDRSTNNTVHNNNVNVEGDSQSQLGVKNTNAWFMRFFDGGRGVVDPETDAALGMQYWPGDAGVGTLRRNIGGPAWSSEGTYTSLPQGVNRNTLQADRAFYWTFYARLDPTQVAAKGLLLPAGAGGVYGAEWCTGGTGAGQPDQNTWACDPAKWYVSGSGTSTMPYYADRTPGKSVALGHVPGEAYTLRDVDCFDGYVGGVPSEGVEVYASLVTSELSPDRTPCRT